MHPAPRGFVLLPGTPSVSSAAVVFEVARASDPDTRLVCKRLGPRARDEVWMDARLAAEADLLRRLAGRGAPEPVDAGRDEHGRWLVMTRVPGRPLAAHVGDPAWVARAARPCLEALAQLHAAGVVHGDVSPANVVVADDGSRAVLVDFDLATWPGAPPMPAGPFRGTLAYAAPEVARGGAPDFRSDLFALAASLLQVASSELPRPESPVAAMLVRAGEASVDAWTARASKGLPPDLARTLAACCRFDPVDRPAGPIEALGALS